MMHPTPHLLPPRQHKARRLALALLLCAPIIYGLIALALGQDVNWDLRNYHWYNAYALLNGRLTTDILPSQTPWFYNPTLDIPFYLAASHTPARVTGFLLGLVQGLNFIPLFMMAHATLIVPNPRHKVIVAALIAALGLAGGGAIAMIGCTFYDNVTSLGIFMSIILILRHDQRIMTMPVITGMKRYFLFALPAGLMMGLKLPSVVFCIGVCFAILFMPGNFKRRVMLCFSFGLGILAGTFISLGAWATFLQTHFGSPLFPYFNGLFKSPLAPLTSARDIQFIPTTWHDRLLFPYIFTQYPTRVGEIPWRDWRIPMLYTLLPLAILVRLGFGRTRTQADAVAVPHAARYLLAVGAISYVVWLVMFSIYRYLVPLEMLAPLLIVITVGMLPLRINARAMLTAFLLLVVVASIQGGNWGRRSAWNDTYVTATIPAISDAQDTMLLMAGFEPYSHIISQFPPAMPVVRIQSNFASPNENKGINAVIRARVEGHKGHFLLIIPPWQHGLAQDALKFFHLELRPQTCQKVVDHLYDNAALDLCKVERTN